MSSNRSEKAKKPMVWKMRRWIGGSGAHRKNPTLWPKRSFGGDIEVEITAVEIVNPKGKRKVRK